ncbi:hypothetical protein DAPPUDRAFT_123962 [Daphnia pulex]|uniref:Uncharacterized protein n=1 Tax=Daphnia pulex TaxID=6669 RepID=E9I685_DAPPU|nr:hypothetical protein DAPPUDRAFT_123962 [Daphnia pulex]|eukprot:EFX60495.1 hypothetical protein DAPPUDRAFT_123962 [Daphnia pulex]
MAERHLRERRNLLELAKRIMADREDSLATLDAKYKTRRERLLLKILMTRAGLLHQKRQRLICRLGVISKAYQKERRRLFRRMEDAEMTVVICRRELALAKKAVWAERLRQRVDGSWSLCRIKNDEDVYISAVVSSKDFYRLLSLGGI